MQSPSSNTGYDRYVADVTTGKQVAGKYVRWAVERHIRDMATGHPRGLYFDRESADFAISCFAFFKHSKGPLAGQPFHLSDWQAFAVAMLFGWMRADGTRRFRRAYIEVARKNGKSTLLSGLGVILAALDGEAGAEVYAAATKRDQAAIVFGEAARMVKASPDLLEFCQVFRNSVTVSETNSKLQPLSSDANSLDGLNVHAAIVDELHAHKTRDLWDVLDTATGARTQPLLIAITTAGSNQAGVCFEIRNYNIDVLDPALDLQDDAFFSFIAAIDDADSWQDEGCWVKANPNLNVSVNIDDLREKAHRAARSASALNNFLIKHLNRWTQQVERWISVEEWDTCKTSDPATFESSLYGRPCYGGLDLAHKADLNAFCLVFRPVAPGEPYKYVWRYWLPEDSIKKHAESGDWRYSTWEKAGTLKATPGSIVDYDVIREDIETLGRIFDIKQIAYDPWSATHLSTQLTASGFTMVEVRQTFQYLSEPSKELEAQVIGGKLEHAGDSLTRWMVDSVAVFRDGNANIKPVKSKDPRKKIDGVVAAILGLGRAVVADEGAYFAYNGF